MPAKILFFLYVNNVSRKSYQQCRQILPHQVDSHARHCKKIRDATLCNSAPFYLWLPKITTAALYTYIYILSANRDLRFS
jgi:hypothetical protein